MRQRTPSAAEKVRVAKRERAPRKPDKMEKRKKKGRESIEQFVVNSKLMFNHITRYPSPL